MEDLQKLYEWISVEKKQGLFVTLTFAQTIDGFISRKGEQLILSGKESMVLTHALRCTHEAIMVGIGTVLIDNPSLTTRFVNCGPNGSPIQHPRPVIVDTHLRIPINSNLISRSPILFCAFGINERKKELCRAGCTIVEVELKNDKLDLQKALQVLSEMGIQSLMIEGGSQIIQDVISKSLMDQVIITISPQLLADGVHSTFGVAKSMSFSTVEWKLFGNDAVVKGIV
jgi:2,5-diamino-6-(ribosylamino)-4(3H)-pyrimidinone 5'-phosphate reductase